MINENFPNFKVKGNPSTQEKKRIEHKIFYNLNDPEEHLESIEKAKEVISKNEIPLSLEEIKMALFADEETNRLMESFGLESFNIPLSNIHLLPSKIIKEIRGNDNVYAFAKMPQYAILMDAANTQDLLVFSSHVFHEILHLKGRLLMEVGNKDTIYRYGVDVFSPQHLLENGEGHIHFEGLHEAIVSSEQMKFTLKLLEMPEFKEDKEFLYSNEGIDIRKDISDNTHNNFDDIYFLNREQKIYFAVGYRNQRKVYSYICQEIAKEINLSEEEIQSKFLRSHFSGNLLSIAKLVEQTFGKGSFRELGSMETDPESSIKTLEALKKFKLRMKK